LPDRLMDILAGLTADDDAPRSAIIIVVNIDGTVNLNYLGGVVTNVPVISTYTPTTGDVVQVMRRGPSSLLVIGSYRTTNPAGGTVASDFVISYNVDAVPTAITGGGTYASEPIYLYGHKNAQKPSGDIYFVGKKIGSIRLAWPGSGVFDLPLSVGQQLQSGYLKGLGLLYNGTGDYVVLNSIANYANSGRLDISWRED
jgi:hypothetical protein